MEQENLLLPDGLFHTQPGFALEGETWGNLFLEKRLHLEESIWRLKSFGSQDKLMQLLLGVEIFFFLCTEGAEMELSGGAAEGSHAVATYPPSQMWLQAYPPRSSEDSAPLLYSFSKT